MDIEVHNIEEHGVTVVALRGDLDTTSSRRVQEALLPLVERGGRLVLELSAVPYMSSAGLRLLLSLYRRVSSLTGRLVLVGVAPDILDTMDVTGFLEFFTACDTLEEALAALGDAPGDRSGGAP